MRIRLAARRYLWRTMGGALILVALATYSYAINAEEDMPDLGHAVRHFVEVFNNLDRDRFLATFADEATVFFPFTDTPRRMTGKDEFGARFMEFFDEVQRTGDGPPYLEIDPRDLEIQRYGTMAIVSFHLRREPALNRRTAVFENRDGAWLIVHLHASVMTPPDDD